MRIIKSKSYTIFNKSTAATRISFGKKSLFLFANHRMDPMRRKEMTNYLKIIPVFLLAAVLIANSPPKSFAFTDKNLPPISKTAVLSTADNKIPVLMYHHISTDDPQGNASITAPDKFKAEMQLIKDQGYTTIFFKDYIEYSEKSAKLPEKPILITFDDGYYSNYKYAYPLLKEMGMKATISLVGWSVGREYDKDGKKKIYKHFTWEQAKEMYDSGVIDIQHHSYDLHSTANGISGVSKRPTETQAEYEKRFREDTVKMKNLIESKVGCEVYVYTYPYGIYNDTTERILKDLGFKVTMTTDQGLSDFSTGLFKVKRFEMSPFVASKTIFSAIASASSQ